MTTSALSAADLAAKSLDLPVVPVVAQKVMDEMTRVSCSAESLSAIIRGDQALMGRILRIANSVFYRRPDPRQNARASRRSIRTWPGEGFGYLALYPVTL